MSTGRICVLCLCLFTSLMFFPLHLCPRSTQQQEMKVVVSLCHRLGPVWRTSGQHRSSSATGPRAHATTLLMSTASGWPPWISPSTPSRRQRRSKRASSCHASAAAKSAWRTCEPPRWHQAKRNSACVPVVDHIRNLSDLLTQLNARGQQPSPVTVCLVPFVPL